MDDDAADALAWEVASPRPVGLSPLAATLGWHIVLPVFTALARSISRDVYLAPIETSSWSMCWAMYCKVLLPLNVRLTRLNCRLCLACCIARTWH